MTSGNWLPESWKFGAVCGAALGVLVGMGLAPALAEVRCGWLENPSPGNLWIKDPAGLWIVSAQGAPPAQGADRLPAPSADRFVATNGKNYGHSCACIAGALDAASMRATRIDKGWLKPLAVCRAEPRLNEP